MFWTGATNRLTIRPADPYGWMVIFTFRNAVWTTGKQKTHSEITMSRVLLIIPPDPLGNRFPALGTGYLAASLIAAGHAVKVFDAGAPFGPGIEYLGQEYDSWRPHWVGVGLYTQTALATYRLVRPFMDGRARWVAGGVHATAVPHEPLRFGFDVAVIGEAEQTLVELAGLPGRGTVEPASLETVRGIAFADENGVIRRTPERPRMADLDRLAPPRIARHLFRREWYVEGGGTGPLAAALITSRGCPGRCIFCSRQVTGHTQRVHSPARIVAEMQALTEQEGTIGFSFHDDAFTADASRVLDLCGRIQGTFSPPPSWWCESRVDHMDDARAARMKAAGCCLVVFGLESGDPEMLRRMGKPIPPEAVDAAFSACGRAGLSVQANMMFGFPEETVFQLENSRRFMERVAPRVGHFTPLGIPIPFPGTPLYDRHARQYGFVDWWLDPKRVAVLQRPVPSGGFSRIDHSAWPQLAREMEEALIAADFFRYTPEVKTAIRRCLDFRHRHNWG